MRRPTFIPNLSQARDCPFLFLLCVRIIVYLELRDPTGHLIWFSRDSDFDTLFWEYDITSVL